MPDWVLYVIGLIGVVVGAAITEFRQWMDRRERYQVMTFEKRLDAHQTALCWCHKLDQALNSQNPKDISRVAGQAREWWSENCLFLDEESRKSMIPAIHYSYQYATEIEHPDKYEPEMRMGHHVWNYIDNSRKAIMEGIGTKYLPEMRGIEEITHIGATAESGRRQKFFSTSVIIAAIIIGAGAVGYMVYKACQLGPNVTCTTKLGYILPASSAIVGLLTTFWAMWKTWLWAPLTIALLLFILGMMFQLISLVETAH